jgi:hypothetical protein
MGKLLFCIRVVLLSGVVVACSGSEGSEGMPGTSVTASVEPPGVNCAYGGSRFETGGTVTYACNGGPGPSGQNGANGQDGMDGQNGANGVDGMDGQPGTSVVSAAEGSGANCTYGGSRFDASGNLTYACNGAPGLNGTNGTNANVQAYYTSGGASVGGITTTWPTYQVVKTATLPAGQYIVYGHVGIAINDVRTGINTVDQISVNCQIIGPGSSAFEVSSGVADLQTPTDGSLKGALQGQFHDGLLVAVMSSSSQFTATLQCTKISGGTVSTASVSNGAITALKVGGITPLP